MFNESSLDGSAEIYLSFKQNLTFFNILIHFLLTV